MRVVTPDRWRVITEIFHGVIARDGASREAFLVAACKADASLRAEVDAMVAAHDQAGSFGETPVFAPALEQLLPGARLGAYRIEALIGAGGMGEVYRARDTRLDRTVAIKILSPRLQISNDLQARFEREARIISQLTHPHICTLYDIGREGKIDFLVLEHVDGETLAARLARGHVPLDQALRIGIEIASALEYAHRHGVVHRDLKPSNVMLTKAGVKLLDFGLAKLRAPLGADSASVRTTPRPETVAGTLIGTLAYMAPEQLEGHEADGRADLWAFGCVLYELTAGRRAFDGASQATLIAAILDREPVPLSKIQPGASGLLDHLIRSCLAKDRETRWQSATDVKRELEWIAGRDDGGDPDGRSARPRRSRWLGGAMLAIGIVVGAAALWALRPVSQETDPPVVVRALLDVRPAEELRGGGVPRVEYIGPIGGDVTALCWTPDGRSIVFAGLREGERRLYLRALTEEQAQPLAGTDGAMLPVISPDGRWVAFWAQGGIKKIPISGGTPSVIVPAIPPPFGMSWGAGGDLLYSHQVAGARRIWLASPGSEPKPVSTLQPGEFAHTLPAWLPGEAAFLYTVRKRLNSWGGDATVVQTRATGARTTLVRDAVDARYASGHLVFLRLGTLFAVPFAPARLEVKAEPIALLANVSQALSGGATYMITGAGQFSVAPNGALAYVHAPVQPYRQYGLATVDRGGKATPLPVPANSYGPNLRVSPDGARLAIPVDSVTERALWIVDLARGVPTKLTPAGDVQWPLWTPDGKRIIFNWVADGRDALAWQPADGSAAPEDLSDNFMPASAQPDGREIVGVWGSDVWALSLADRTRRPIIRTPAIENFSELSPDSRWLAYGSNVSGQPEVYVQPFPGPGPRTQLSHAGGGSIAWNPNGREVFFVGQYRPPASGSGAVVRLQMLAAGIENGVPVGQPRVLFEFDGGELSFTCAPVRCYDVARDGRFFVRQRLPAPPQLPVTHINIVLNWMDDVRAKLRR